VLPTPTKPDEGYELIGGNKDDNCCLNGGICIMNSFCYCSEEYYGRFCEHRVLERSCGSLPHGKWMAAGCHLCHCFDGQLRCKVTSIKGCDGHGLVQGVE
ncbi:TDGF1-like protein, partial [Mya arenaria]